MRRFISILFALVLVLSFSLIPAMPVAANGAPNPTFATVDRDTLTTPSAEINIRWESAPGLPDIPDVGSPGNAIHVTTSIATLDYAMVIVPTDFILGESTGISYWGYTVSGDVVAPDEIFLFLDTDNNGVFDTLLTSHKPGPAASECVGTWREWKSTDPLNDWHTAIPYVEANPDDYSGARVLAIALTAGPPVGIEPVSVDVYFDKLTLNGSVLLDNDTGIIDVPVPFPYSPQPSIQDAINAALPGTTISVAAGTYSGGTNSKWAIYIDKPITLLGAQAGVDARNRSGAESIIDATGYGVGIYIVGEGDHTVIDGFEVKNSGYVDQRGAGIGLEDGADYVTIRNTYVHSNNNQGIQSFLRNSSNQINNHILIEKCRLEGNGDSGVKVYGSSHVTVQDNLFRDNGDFGVLVWDYRTVSGYVLDNVQILRNQFFNNCDNIKLDGGETNGIITNAVVASNEIRSGQRGIYLKWNVASAQVYNNEFEDNDVQVDDKSGGLDIGAVLANNTFDRAVTVDHPGGSLLHTIWSKIQDGIDAALAGDTINVAAGTYSEHLTIDKSNLKLIGEDKETTIIDARQDSSWEFPKPGILINGVSSVTVSGFTIRDAALDENGEPWAKEPYGPGPQAMTAILIYATSSDHVIENNILINNHWGVFVCAEGSATTECRNNRVANNIIRDSGQDGVYLYTDGVVAVENTEIVNNEMDNLYGEYASGVEFWAWPETEPKNLAITGTVITGNDITSCTFGVRIRSDVSDITGTSVNDNEFENNGLQVLDGTGTLNIQLVLDTNTFDRAVTVDHPEASLLYTIWSKIQDGIDNAVAGDTVIVAAGTYNEAILIDRPLTLRGATAGVNKNGYTVPAGYAWDDTVESIINHPNPSGGYTTIVDIVDVDNVTFEGFVVQELNAVGNLNSSLLRVYAHTQEISNIVVRNNVIGPNTNTTAQDGAQGRMGLYIVNHPYSDNGVVNSTFSGNKIFDCKGDGNNVFVWSSYYAYGAPGPASMSGTVIEDNEIYGSHRSGIETAGGFSGLTIRNNKIYGNSGLPSDDPNHLKYGNGILLIRGSSDKTSGPTTAYGPEDLTIIDNEIYDNEKNAIYMGPINKDYTINGNKIYDNGWDGIRLDLEGTYWNPTFEPGPSEWSCYDGSENIAAQFNNIYDNVGYGVQVIGTPTNDFVLDATNNWWGTKAGGLIKTKKVSGSVDYDPWIGAKAKNSKSKKTGTDDETVDARDEAGTEVVKKGKGKPTITVTEYIDNPGDGAPGGFTSAGKYIDVHIDDPEDVDEIEIRNYYTEADITGLDEATLRLSWWNGTLWVECSDSGVNTADTDGYSGYVWAKIRDDTTPTLDDMAGTPFMSMGTPAAPPPVGGGGGGGGGGAVVFSPAISNLTITPAEGAIAEVRIGEIVTITTEVENTGGRSGSYTVTLKINGVVEKEKTVTLAAYAKETVTFTVIREEAGTYKIEVNGLEGEFIVPELPAATFEPTDLSISPAKVKVGETVTISVLVAETSGVSGSYDATLKINGTVVEKQEVTLGPQQSQTVTFTIANQEAGSYKVEVNGLVSEFTVEAPAPEAPSPPAPAPPPAKAINWWLIGGIIAAVVVVGSVTFILVRRRAY